jgi:uncharacterized protein (DUF305 family)
MVTITEPERGLDTGEAGRGDGALRRVLVAVIAIAALLVAGGAGYALGHRHGSSAPNATSVDAGFAWDMSVHHRQAVTMAGFVRDHTSDSGIEKLAYDIETSQYNQVGQMQGWLDTWGLPTQSTQTQMAWMSGSDDHMDMSADGLMPGMATQAQITKLESLSGKALDVFFLQLMLHHHQGGLPMAQWAATHAGESYVRNAAEKMATAQGNEIVQMEQLLRERGASPLPPPA